MNKQGPCLEILLSESPINHKANTSFTAFNYTQESDGLQQEKATIMLESTLTTLVLKKLCSIFRKLSIEAPRKRIISMREVNQANQEEYSLDKINKYSRVKRRKASSGHSLSQERKISASPKKQLLLQITHRLSENRRSRILHSASRESLLKKSVHKMEQLRKNICQEKKKSILTSRKKQQLGLDSQIKEEKFNELIEEIAALKEEVKEVKKLNQSLLNNSTEHRSLNLSPIKALNMHTAEPMSSPGYTNPQLMRKLGLVPRPSSSSHVLKQHTEKKFHSLNSSRIQPKSQKKNLVHPDIKRQLFHQKVNFFFVNPKSQQIPIKKTQIVLPNQTLPQRQAQKITNWQPQPMKIAIDLNRKQYAVGGAFRR